MREFVETVAPILARHAGTWEIVLVDDGSPDDTWDWVSGLASDYPGQVRAIRLSRNFGKEAALVAGLEVAAGRAVITMDADLQHPPSVIPAMLDLWRAGAQVVDGIKSSRTGQSRPHRVLAWAFNGIFTRLTGVGLTAATDFKLMSREAVTAFLSLTETNLFYRGTAAWIGFSRATVGFRVDERASGRSKFTAGALLRLAARALTSFTAAPLHFVTIAGAVFAVFAMILGIQTIVRFFVGDAVEGFTTLILVVLVLGSLVLVGLGIIGEYLARIHDEVKARPRYLIRDRIDR